MQATAILGLVRRVLTQEAAGSQGQGLPPDHEALLEAAEPEEVARLAVYLASEDADYITGATFTIDGGLTINAGQGA